jgi:hypothetical protein
VFIYFGHQIVGTPASDRAGEGIQQMSAGARLQRVGRTDKCEAGYPRLIGVIYLADQVRGAVLSVSHHDGAFAAAGGKTVEQGVLEWLRAAREGYL